MKILFYINVLTKGGAERVITNLANRFVEDNEVIVVNTYKKCNEYSLDSRVKHIYLEDYCKSNNFIVKNIQLIKALRHIIKENRPDICISFMGEPNIRLLLSTIGISTKVLVSVRNDPNKEYDSFLLKYSMFILCRRANGIVFQTKDAMNFFPKSIRNKARIIYNPVNKKFYKRENMYNYNKKNIVSVGRLSEQKNYFLLIEAFSSIANQIDDNLYIYGEGCLHDKLQLLIDHNKMNKRIILMGNSDELSEELLNYKLFVMSSDYEGLPNALMEAMALGIPCISTDCPCGGPRELLIEEELVEVNNKDLLSKKILSLLEDKSLLQHLSEYNYNKAKSFNEEIITNEWFDYIKKLVEDAK